MQKSVLENLTLVAEIIGAIAVVVSVIYLGVQIKENTKILRTQAHYSALSLAQRPFEMVVQRTIIWPNSSILVTASPAT